MAQVTDIIEEAATVLLKLAVTSRMARVPLEKPLPRFLGYPVRVETVRLPSKATKLTIAIGRHRRQRVVPDQRSTAIHAAARTLAQRLYADVALDFVLSQGDSNA